MKRWLIFLLVLTACDRTDKPRGAATVQVNRTTEAQPGPADRVARVENRLPENEETIGEGKRLYGQMNCAGCHAGGGGAIGPPLMDDEWIYGSSAGNIYSTIVEGRPQGMPAFGGRIADEQVWQIVAYVRSLAKLTQEDPANERAQATETPSDAVSRGRQVFLKGPCALCHTIRGTGANATVGPDLTHVASRQMIGAATLANNRENLAQWIRDPQSIKPGVQMPATPMKAEELNDLVAYLQSLK